MAVVAVLEIHMERTAVGSMKPSRTLLGELPTLSNTLSPTRLKLK